MCYDGRSPRRPFLPLTPTIPTEPPAPANNRWCFFIPKSHHRDRWKPNPAMTGRKEWNRGHEHHLNPPGPTPSPHTPVTSTNHPPTTYHPTPSKSLPFHYSGQNQITRKGNRHRNERERIPHPLYREKRLEALKTKGRKDFLRSIFDPCFFQLFVKQLFHEELK